MKNVVDTLTFEKQKQFREDGFLMLKQILPLSDLQPMISELSDQVEEGVQSAILTGLLSVDQTFSNASFATRLAHVYQACSDPSWIWNNHFRYQKPRSADMFSVRTACPLLDMIESIIGPEIFAHPQFNFRAKSPKQQVAVIPWHQDLAYLVPEDADDTLVVNPWISLVPTDIENGCLQLIKGAHQFGLLPHEKQDLTPSHTGNVGIAEGHLPTSKIVTAEMSF